MLGHDAVLEGLGMLLETRMYSSQIVLEMEMNEDSYEQY